MYIYIFFLRKKSFVSAVTTFVYVLAEIRTTLPTDFNTQNKLVKSVEVLNEKSLNFFLRELEFFFTTPQKIAVVKAREPCNNFTVKSKPVKMEKYFFFRNL